MGVPGFFAWLLKNKKKLSTKKLIINEIDKKIKYLMIDEYQDFSNLFFQLVNTISKYNKELKIVCVGDDWQLINSFAGSQKEYFDEFGKSYFIE